MKKRSTRLAKGAKTKEYYSSGEIARLFGVTSRTVANWCDKGLLAYIETPAGHRRIPASAIKGRAAADEQLATFQQPMKKRQGKKAVPTSEPSAKPLPESAQQPKIQPKTSATVATSRTGDGPAGEPGAGNEKVAIVAMWLRVENNSKFVRGKTRVRANIERYILQKFAMKKKTPDGWEYELRIPYRDDAHLDQRIDDMIREMDNEADGRNCFIEVDVREEGTERSW